MTINRRKEAIMAIFATKKVTISMFLIIEWGLMRTLCGG
jgi:hypothetical protein